MKVCTQCVMDETDEEISFDEDGVCNHCRRYFQEQKRALKPAGLLKPLVDKIKREQRKNEYDCVLGISGGLDSSYVAYLAKKLGLRTLLVHFDNGWNTPEAENNIRAIVQNTGFDFVRRSCDFEEVRDLQLAYLKASVINLEVVTDHAIRAAVYGVAYEYNVKYILKGTNWVTEGVLPKSWGYRHTDLRNIKSIHKKYGTIRLKTYPTMGLVRFVFSEIFKGIEAISLLNYVDYDYARTRDLLSEEWGWQDYGNKHGECICTRFYQQYILPTKLGFDKRKAHLSTLICSGQVTRDEALEILEEPLYEQPEYERDREVFLDKLGITDEEFDGFMSLPVRGHKEFGTDAWLYNALRYLLHSKRRVLSLLRKAKK